MAPQTSIRLTYEDYCAIPDDGRRHEIIDGEHYVNPSPVTRHQLISMRLVLALGNFVYDRGLGHVFHAPFDVVLAEHDIVEPDIIFVSMARAHIITKKNIQGAPDLLIEILSGSHPEYDTRLKYQTYERRGVAEYWIVDPDRNTITIYRRSGAAFIRADVGDTLTTPLLPGFELPLEPLFA
jgi:Uma2 family endonuclease